jgi:hypothetical protein
MKSQIGPLGAGAQREAEQPDAYGNSLGNFLNILQNIQHKLVF